MILPFFISCNLKKSNDELEFVNKDFKSLIDNAINKINKNESVEFKDLVIRLKIFKSDTLLFIDNTPPYELDNLKILKDYRGYKVYIYADNILDDKLNELIKLNEKEILFADKSILIDYETYSYYSNFYLFKNKKIYEIELPKVWSTDSTNNLKSFDRLIKIKN